MTLLTNLLIKLTTYHIFILIPQPNLLINQSNPPKSDFPNIFQILYFWITRTPMSLNRKENFIFQVCDAGSRTSLRGHVLRDYIKIHLLTDGGEQRGAEKNRLEPKKPEKKTKKRKCYLVTTRVAVINDGKAIMVWISVLQYINYSSNLKKKKKNECSCFNSSLLS